MFTREEACRVAAALNVMALNFKAELKDALLEDWLCRLSRYPASRVLAVIDEIIEDYAFKTLPPYAEFKKRLEGTRAEQDAAQKSMAVADWDAMLDQVYSLGRNGQPRLSKTAWAVLRVMGGWEGACSWREDDLNWKRKEFLELWPMYYEREDLMALGSDAVKLAAHGQSALPQKNRDALPAAPGQRAPASVPQRQLPSGFLRRVDDPDKRCRVGGLLDAAAQIQEESRAFDAEYLRMKANPGYVPSYKGRQDPLAGLSKADMQELARAVGEPV